MIHQERKYVATSEVFLRHLEFVNNEIKKSESKDKAFPSFESPLISLGVVLFHPPIPCILCISEEQVFMQHLEFRN